MNLDTLLPLLATGAAADSDLAEVALSLAREEYADVDVEAYLGELTALAHDVRPRLRGGLEAKVRGLCRYLFHELGFRGNTQHYYDPRNSYFNQVLDRRTGIPLTLSLVTLAIGRRAGLWVEGVALPGHFVAKAVDGDEEVLFDPYHGGRLLSPEQCEALVQQVTGAPFEATPSTLAAAPVHTVVVRLLSNLKGTYLMHQPDFPRAVRVMRRLCQLLPDDPTQRRDLGAALVHAGQPGRALDQLDAYLATVPQADDADAVRQLQNQARAAIAKWN